MTHAIPDSRRIRASSFTPFAVLAAVIVFATVLPSGPTYGQADPDTLLPDIAPREFEILGNLEVAFPSLRRRPLSGFNPPPRIYEVPRGRQPWTEDYKQDAVDIPGSSLADPMSPSTTLGRHPGPARGELSVGFGRFLGRSVHGKAGLPIGSRTVASADVRYEGMDGFEPFSDLANVDAPFDALDGQLGLEVHSRKAIIGLAGFGAYDEFTVYGASRRVGVPGPGFEERPKRDAFTLGAHVWVESGPSVPFPANLSLEYGGTRVRTEAYPGATDDPRFRTAEKRLTVQGSAHPMVRGAELTFLGVLDVGGIDTDALLASDITAYQFGSDIAFRLRDLRIRVGGRLMGFNASADDVSTTFVSPILVAEYYAGKRLRLFGGQQPEWKSFGLRDALDANRFLIDEPAIRPTLTRWSLHGGGEFVAGPIRLQTRFGYKAVEQFPFYTEAEKELYTDAYESGFFEARYGDVSYPFAEVGVTFSMPNATTVAATMEFKNPEFDDSDGEVPFAPAVEGTGVVSIPFLKARGLLQSQLSVAGERPVDATGDSTLAALIQLDSIVGYYVMKNLGLFARFVTTSGQRWIGYPEPDWSALAGIRIRW